MRMADEMGLIRRIKGLVSAALLATLAGGVWLAGCRRRRNDWRRSRGLGAAIQTLERGRERGREKPTGIESEEEEV